MQQRGIRNHRAYIKAVIVWNANKVKIFPLEDDEANNRVGPLLDSIVEEDNLDEWVDVASPCIPTVHARTLLALLFGLVLRNRR